MLRYAAGKHRLAEIGVWEGGTTRKLRAVMSPEGALFAIDPFPRGRLGVSYQHLIAHGEVNRVTNGRVFWIRSTGVAAARSPAVASEPFDFIFIDADHTYEGLRADWEAWSPLASNIVALHDAIGDQDQGSVRFVRERVITDRRFTTIETAGCLLMLKRVAQS